MHSTAGLKSNISTMENISQNNKISSQTYIHQNNRSQFYSNEQPVYSNSHVTIGNSFIGANSNHFQSSSFYQPSLNSIFSSHSNNFSTQISYLLNEIEIVKQRIQSKALGEQKYIDGIYLELKQIQKQLSVIQGTCQDINIQKQKQLVKLLTTKVKMLAQGVNQYIDKTVNDKQKAMKKSLSDRYLFFKDFSVYKLQSNDFSIQQKYRQKQFSSLIDILAHSMMDLQQQLHLMKQQSQSGLRNFQTHLWGMQNELKVMILQQKKQTQNSHDIIMKLINTVVERMAEL